MTNRPLSPDLLLAQGFADRAASWALAHGAPATTLAVLRRAAFEASHATTEGHVCARLADIAPMDGSDATDEVRDLLLASGVVGTPDAPGTMPLIIDEDGRIYLHRYFDYERRLARHLVRLNRSATATHDAPLAMHGGKLTNWQKAAVAMSVLRQLTIISGGPGTGKTTTVVSILANLLEADPGCRIVLAAPTGKAAARMLEAIRIGAQALPETLRDKLPTESRTIHRLLGVTGESGRFRHHAQHPLALDALVVDEASMLDLALAAHLFDALPAHARIVLLGDKDQLSAVEAGAVFSEISAAPSLTPPCMAALSVWSGIPLATLTTVSPAIAAPLPDSVIWLSESFRFSSGSGIGQLADGIRAGNADACIALLEQADGNSLKWIQAVAANADWQPPVDGFAAYRLALASDLKDRPAIFRAFDQFRVLCALRSGPQGVEAINRQISAALSQQLGHAPHHGDTDHWYPGRPVMIRRNDYALRLFNGDIGIALPDETGALMVYFEEADGQFRAIAPMRLPEHETAFAMTVHKSQGSEFDEVLLLLPASPHRGITRELLYTAISRARKKVCVAGSEAVMRQGIGSPTQRQSGLTRQMERWNYTHS